MAAKRASCCVVSSLVLAGRSRRFASSFRHCCKVLAGRCRRDSQRSMAGRGPPMSTGGLRGESWGSREVSVVP